MTKNKGKNFGNSNNKPGHNNKLSSNHKNGNNKKHEKKEKLFFRVDDSRAMKAKKNKAFVKFNKVCSFIFFIIS